MPQLQVLLHYFNIHIFTLFQIHTLSYSGLVALCHVFRQPWGNRVERADQYFFLQLHDENMVLNFAEYPLPQTWLLNPVTSDGESLCVMATSWIQLFATQSPVPSSFTQLRRAQSLSIPSSVTGEEAEPQTQFHTILAQHTWGDSKTRAELLQLILISFSYCLMATSLPQSQVLSSRGIVISIVLFQHRQMLQQHRAISTQCSWIMNRGGKKTIKGFKKTEASWQHSNFLLIPLLGLTIHH